MGLKFWNISLPYLNQAADYAHHIAIPHPDLKTFLRPWAKASWSDATGLSEPGVPGVPGVPWHPQIVADHG